MVSMFSYKCRDNYYKDMSGNNCIENKNLTRQSKAIDNNLELSSTNKEELKRFLKVHDKKIHFKSI